MTLVALGLNKTMKEIHLNKIIKFDYNFFISISTCAEDSPLYRYNGLPVYPRFFLFIDYPEDGGRRFSESLKCITSKNTTISTIRILSARLSY